MTAELEIIYRDTDELVPYANNARTHSRDQVAQIVDSITRFGFTNPILIDEDNSIIAGHGRVLAAGQMELEKVPTITLTNLTPEERRAYVLVDNKLALNAGWDKEMLSLEIAELADANFEMMLLGWDQSEIDVMSGNVATTDFPDLNSTEKQHREMNFVVHATQCETINAALKLCKEHGGGESDVNENSNGNALAHICNVYLEAHG